MRQTTLHIYARLPRPAMQQQPRLLLANRSTGSASSHPSLILQRLQQRAFHPSSPCHRKPTSSGSKPKSQPPKPQAKFQSPTVKFQIPTSPVLRTLAPNEAPAAIRRAPAAPIPKLSLPHIVRFIASKTREKLKLRWLFIALLLCAAPPLFIMTYEDDTPLNPDTFAHFTITDRLATSPSAFVLTAEPAAVRKRLSWYGGLMPADAVVADAWLHGLWAVEVKQPEMQVAREYTPLPPPEIAGRGLRLYVRQLEGGSLSGYLSKLGVGNPVQLRGPRTSFDLRGRLGLGRDGKVVFLAGGTGIAPALQAAKRLLDGDEGIELQVVWANRQRGDCIGVGIPGREGVVEMLEDYKRRFPDRFSYTCTVDDEGSFIDAATIERSLNLTPAPLPTTATPSTPSRWNPTLWVRGSTPTSTATPPTATPIDPPTPTINTAACTYHSPKNLVTSDDRDPPATSITVRKPCECYDANGNPVAGGKNLLLVSGPEGFVAKFAGAKVWGGGKEMQGPVGGVIGELERKYPRMGEEWLVLKL